MAKAFIRQDSNRHSKLGKHRKNLQKWRKPKGRQSKMRKKRKSYPVQVSIGFSSPKSDTGKILGLIPLRVVSLADIAGLKKSNIAILSSTLGAKKKMEAIKLLEKSGIEIFNLKVKENKK